jgi:hypothetical protein
MRLQACSVVLLALAAAACSEGSVPPPARDAAQGESGEQLLAAPPGGFKEVFSSDNPGLRMVEYIPRDETRDSWQQKVTFEALSGEPLPDPIEFMNALAADQAGACAEGFSEYTTFSGLENGYPTSVHLMVCRRNRVFEQSQITMLKAIQGNESFYVITRAQRAAPLAEGASPLSEAAMGGWALYLKAISLCDGSRAEHPCP